MACDAYQASEGRGFNDGLLKVVELLIARGANVNARGKRGRLPADFAAARDASDILRVLEAAGAKKSPPKEGGKKQRGAASNR